MSALERHRWREEDASEILKEARIVGRAEGIGPDGGRFHGLIVQPVEGGIQYVVFWHRGTFLIEEIPLEGTSFTCETCGFSGIVGVDGPLYGRDRDPRQASVMRCRACTTQVD